MKNNILNLFLFLATVAIVIYSCSKSSSNQQAPDSTTSGGAVSIQNFAFVPDTIRIKAGQTVTWTNKDTAPHTTTSLTGTFNSANLSTNQTFQFTFNTAGTFSYHCTVHPMMATAYVVVSN